KGLGRFGFQNGATLNLETERRPPEYMTGAETSGASDRLEAEGKLGPQFFGLSIKKVQLPPVQRGLLVQVRPFRSARSLCKQSPGSPNPQMPGLVRCVHRASAAREKQSLCYRLALEAFRRRWPTENP